MLLKVELNTITLTLTLLTTTILNKTSTAWNGSILVLWFLLAYKHKISKIEHIFPWKERAWKQFFWFMFLSDSHHVLRDEVNTKISISCSVALYVHCNITLICMKTNSKRVCGFSKESILEFHDQDMILFLWRLIKHNVFLIRWTCFKISFSAF